MSTPRRDERLTPPWPDLLTIRQAAAMLNVSSGSVKYWVYRVRLIPHVSLGSGKRRICRIRRTVIEELIARGERPAFRLVRGGKQ